jgi:glycerophosphoryl diester phosphodiesterase
MSIVLFTGVLMVQAQNKKTMPEEKSIVNKEFDENGNLLKYDSTYVWQWNSDSTFNFSFDDNFAFGKQFPGMFEEFFNDSVFEQFGFLNKHDFQPFSDEEFFKHFQHSFPDSAFIQGFPFEQDSIFSFDFGNQFPGNFDFRELEDLQKQLQEKFNQHNLMIPEFKSPEQQEEWEKLMQKQQKEKEELMKKWENPQSKKIY